MSECKLGTLKRLIPLMSVFQMNKEKVRPMLDYRELKQHVDSFTSDADVCTRKLREGVNREQGT